MLSDEEGYMDETLMHSNAGNAPLAPPISKRNMVFLVVMSVGVLVNLEMIAISNHSPLVCTCCTLYPESYVAPAISPIASPTADMANVVPPVRWRGLVFFPGHGETSGRR